MHRPLIIPDSVRLNVSEVQEPVWYDLGIVPAMELQVETLTARQIRFIKPANGYLIVGFGEWTLNTADVPITGYHQDSGEAATLLPVESVGMWRSRTIEGAEYLPWTDPTEFNVGGYTTNASGQWINHPSPFVLSHVFDIKKVGQNLIFACSADVAGEIVQSEGVIVVQYADGTWEEVLKTGIVEGDVEGTERFYVIMDLDDGRIGVRASVSDRGFSSLDGITWEEDDSVPTPLHVANDTYPQVDLPEGYWEQNLFNHTCSVIHNGYVWAGAITGHVWRAKV